MDGFLLLRRAVTFVRDPSVSGVLPSLIACFICRLPGSEPRVCNDRLFNQIQDFPSVRECVASRCLSPSSHQRWHRFAFRAMLKMRKARIITQSFSESPAVLGAFVRRHLQPGKVEKPVDPHLPWIEGCGSRTKRLTATVKVGKREPGLFKRREGEIIRRRPLGEVRRFDAGRGFETFLF